MDLTSWNEHTLAGEQTHGVAIVSSQAGVCRSRSFAGSGTCASCEPLTTFPNVRVREDHELVHVLTELPGVDADELEISVEGLTLTLQGRRREESGVFRADFRVGRGVQKFLCRIELPCLVDRTRGQVYLDMGVLSLTLPKQVCEPASTIKQTY